jgi:hypothetical protein
MYVTFQKSVGIKLRILFGGGILRSTIHKLIHSIWKKEEVPDQ